MQYEDPTLDCLVTCYRRLYKDKEVQEQESVQPIPEDLMEEIAPHVGDAGARLTVGGTLSSNVDYHKAEAFVSVTVPCNNNLEDVQKAHDIVRGFIGTLLLDDIDYMKRLRDSARSGVKTASPPKALQLVAEAEPPQKKVPDEPVSVGQKIVTRPTFRR